MQYVLTNTVNNRYNWWKFSMLYKENLKQQCDITDTTVKDRVTTTSLHCLCKSKMKLNPSNILLLEFYFILQKLSCWFSSRWIKMNTSSRENMFCHFYSVFEFANEHRRSNCLAKFNRTCFHQYNYAHTSTTSLNTQASLWKTPDSDQVFS